MLTVTPGVVRMIRDLDDTNLTDQLSMGRTPELGADANAAKPWTIVLLFSYWSG
ncbi:MAG: hypothetical protein U0892_04995 [Pirellulales bacterium]